MADLQTRTAREMRKRSLSGFAALWLVLAMATVAVITASDADASHFRFGHITWKARPDVAANAVEITVLNAWRRSATSPLVNVGSTPPAFAILNFGDSGSSNITGTVIFVDAAADWYLAKYTTVHTYPNQGPFTAFFNSCCRISTLQNGNHDINFFVATDIDLRNGNQGSPVSSIPAIVQLPKTSSVIFPLPIADPDLDSVTCRMATLAESQLAAISNAGGNFLSVTSDCKLSWNTSATAFGQLYGQQVMLQEHRPNNVINDVALDFIIQIADVSVNAQPTCTVNGSSSNVIAVGQNFSITVTGTDPDGGNLTVANLGLPPGATLTPASGTSPVTATFNWTPAPSDAGSAYAVTVLFTDPGNLQATCSFSVTVPRNQPPNAICQGVTAQADANCKAGADINNGSYDPDGDPITLAQNPAAPPATPFGLGSTLANLTVTDNKGASSSCSATVTVNDTTLPVISCPAGQTVECTGSSSATATFSATATDNCSVGSPTCNPASGSSFPLGTTTPVSCSATDGSGNSSSCSTSVTVVDTTRPSIACPATVTAECTGSRSATVTPGSATASDTCSSVTIAGPTLGSYPVGSTQVTYTATDTSGNSASCISTIQVTDTTPPNIACGPSQTVKTSQNPNNTCSASLTATATGTDTCGAATTTCTPSALSLSSPGATSASCTATDGSGNTSQSCPVSLTLIDDTVPVVTCPAPVTAECTGNGGATVTTAATATDNCAGSVPASGPSSAFYALGTTSISYSASDPSRNNASCSSSVTVRDTTPPNISCPARITAECTGPNGAFVTPGAASASDICTGVTVASPAAGTYPIGTTTVTYIATDTSQNSNSCDAVIQVVDTTKPTLSCVQSVNPSGKNVPQAQKVNEDGFYLVSGGDTCSTPTIKIGSFAVANGETIKITQTPGKSGVTLVNTMGQPAIKHFQVGPSDAVITATDGLGNTTSVTCLVPPPPK